MSARKPDPEGGMGLMLIIGGGIVILAVFIILPALCGLMGFLP